MKSNRLCALALAAGLCTMFNLAHADDVCSGAERAASNAQLARARSAEAAGNLAEALRLANDPTGCADDVPGQRRIIVSASYQLGQTAERAGDLDAAFDYYQSGMTAEQYENPKPHDLLGNAKRVALIRVDNDPTNRTLARDVLDFMNRERLSDGVQQLVAHMDAQAQRLLAEEQRVFSIENPRSELLDEAESWLDAQVMTGVPESTAPTAAAIRARAEGRGDQFAALDYAVALSHALDYYSDAERPDRADTVRAKARRLADGLAGGSQWGEAVELYRIAGDFDRAEALTREREASAAEVEANRQQRFQQEQSDLESELGF